MSTTSTSSPINRSLIVASACLAQVMIVLDTTIIAVALPSAQAGLGLTDAQRPWAITAYTLTFGSLLLVGGRLSQAWGIRRTFLIGLAGFAAASLIGGIATAGWVFLLARALQGVFAALLAPTNLSMMNVAFPETSDRAKAFALFGAVAGAGAALGLILGGVLTDAMSWRWCLWVNLPIAVVAVWIASRALGSLPGPHRSSGAGDIFGLVLSSAGVFSLVFGLSRAETHGWSDPLTTGFLLVGICSIAAFLFREHVAPDPMLPLGILANRVRAASYLSIACVGIAQMGSSLYLTYYFQEQLGYSPTRAGVLFLPLVGGLIVAAIVSTRVIVPRWGVRFAYPFGALVQAAAFAMLSTVGPASPFGANLTLPLVVGGLGIGVVMAPAMSFATAGTTARYSGLASAVANTSQQLGASLGVAFLATWAARHVANGMAARAQAIQAEAILQMRETGVAPGSAAAEGIITALRRAMLDEEVLAAYGSGFKVLSTVALVLALATGALLSRESRRS